MTSIPVLVSFLALGLSVATLAPPSSGAAEVPYQLADINKVDNLISLAEEPADFFPLNGRLLFSTVSESTADEGILWSTDGTAAGTVQVSSSICPARCLRIRPMVTARGITFLSVKSGEPETISLARTDGTTTGTYRLTDPASGEPLLGVVAVFPLADAGAVLFEACLASGPCQLWRSDGTQGGTALALGADGRPFFGPQNLVHQGNRVAFIASQDGDQTNGLWITDGTPKGTVRLADIPFSDTQSVLLATPSQLFFAAGPTGEDLWATDGTPGNAHRLVDFPRIQCTPPPVTCDSSDVESLFVDGDAAYLVVHRPHHGTEIWRSDGTVAGTGPVLELPAGLFLAAQPQPLGERWLLSVNSSQRQRPFLWTADAGFARAAPLTGCGGGGCPSFAGFLAPPSNGPQLFAGADAAHGIEPWITDGTGAGTRRLTDACPGACSGLRFSTYVFPYVFPGPSGRLYFRAYPTAGALDGVGDQLWVTDGTLAGTHQAAGHVSGLGLLDGRTYFGEGHARHPAAELWVTTGTLQSVRRVAVLRRFSPGSYPRFQAFQDGALFLAGEGTSGAQRLWASDGTPAGTVPILGFTPDSHRSLGSFLSPVASAGPLQLFSVGHQVDVNRAGLSEIWRTDGTAAGTRPVFEFGPFQALDTATASWQGKLLFDVYEPTGCSYWTSDGTTAGTRRILPPSPALSCPSFLIPFDSRFLIFIEAGSRDTGRVVPQLFISDGTPAGTRQLTSIHGLRFLFLDNQAVQVGGKVFFRIASLYGVPQLWETDGTPEGTHRASPLLEVNNLYPFEGSLYFTAALPSGDGFGLFRVPLPDESPILLTTSPAFLQRQPTTVGDHFLFISQDPLHGAEPWVSDGTPEGTHLLADLQPGAGSSNPQDFTMAGDRLFFSADDGTYGRELWESDGTAEGTRRISDIAPGGFSALNPASYYPPVVSNGFFFFAADDGQTGIEPWAYRVAP